MKDPIERQEAIERIVRIRPSTPKQSDYSHGVDVGMAMAIVAIEEQPSAQPELIRCKECKHYNAGFECLIEGYGIERDKDWFCGDAERREEDD